MLLDTASMYFRAFYGVPNRAKPGEAPVNAIRGLLDMISSLVTTYSPTELVCCWDDDWRPAFRVEALPSYKAHRLSPSSPEGVSEEEVPPELAQQIPVIIEVLSALGIARIGSAGFEADDVIGTLVSEHAGRLPVDVVTGDRDLFQLLAPDVPVRVIYLGRGGVREPDLVDCEWLHGKYGVASGAAYADMAVLRGDPSDGLPGVKGIGDKTAATLIAQHGDLLGVVRAAGDGLLRPGLRTALLDAADYLVAAPGVVAVSRTASVPPGPFPLPRTWADATTVERLGAESRLTAQLARLATALSSSTDAPVDAKAPDAKR